MDWKTFIAATLTSIGGAGILLLLAFFLIKKWLGTRIERSVKHEYDKKLEEHKAMLQDQVNRSVQEMRAKYQDAADQKAADKTLFMKFLDALPSSGSIEFVRMFDLDDGPYSDDDIDQLDNFRLEWERPENKFLDEELDYKRQILVDLSLDYICFLSEYTSPHELNRKISSIPKELKEEHPEQVKEAVDELRSIADQLVKAHEDLIITARKKLKI